MKLTGLQIFKYLPGGKKEPQANCKKCGLPTCMAFAMKLAKNEESIDKCTFATDELKAQLEESSQLQQQEIVFGNFGNIGGNQNKVKVGNETVMFRHDKKFVNQTCIAVKLNSSDACFEEKFERIKNYSVERVGECLKISAVALVDCDQTFEEKAIYLAESGFSVILISDKIHNISLILEKAADLQKTGEFKPLIFIKNLKNIEELEKFKKYDIPIILQGKSIEKLCEYSSALLEKDFKNIVLNLTEQNPQEVFQNLTLIRRSAIENKFKPLGFPVLMCTSDIVGISDDPLEEGLWASAMLCKYSNIILLENFNEAVIYSLLTLRQNIYTDPEKPLQIESGLYPIGEVSKNSPVIVTTNFALTYFTVAGEIEASGIPCYLLITPSDGMSVLTAWSADKFNGAIIAKSVKDSGLKNLVGHKKLIISGYVSSLKSEIEEELPGWEVVIGASEATELVDFLKNYSKKLTSQTC